MLPNIVDSIIENLLESKLLKHIEIPEKDLSELLHDTRQLLMVQPILLELKAPINILSDIHGQFKDMIRYFQESGYPPNKQYLFLGDYVDRGLNSIETLTLLFAYKLKYPNNIHLLRGNHEDAKINRVYGFFDECKRRLTIRLWRCYVDCYNCLPIAAIIEKKIFCCHGGLSPNILEIDDIYKISRPSTVPESGLLCDLLWSDPSAERLGWGPNPRGVSFTFGSDVVDLFLSRFDFDLICRGHQVVEDGYELFAKRRMITIFSAVNYCGVFDNAGAMACVSRELTISFHVLKPPKKIRINDLFE